MWETFQCYHFLLKKLIAYIFNRTVSMRNSVTAWQELLIDEPKVRRLRPADHFFAKMGQPRPRMLSAGLELGLSE